MNPKFKNYTNVDLGYNLRISAADALEMLDELTARGWQPISTAPKDGTIIDLWLGPPYNQRLADHKFSEGNWAGLEFNEYEDEDRWVERYWEPTHWMPLPLPPGEDS